MSMLTDDITIGQHTSHCTCDVHYHGDLKVEMECTLWQDGEPCGYLNGDRDAEYRVKVCLLGHLRYHLCGKLCVSVHVECLGPGQEITLPKDIKDLDPCSDDHCYDFVIPIPAGTLSPDPDEECGQVCCFVATLTSLTPCDPPRPGHIACWCKGPCVMIHQEPA